MNFVHTLRTIVLVTTFTLAAVILRISSTLSGDEIDSTTGASYFYQPVIVIAISASTLLIIPALIVSDRVRRVSYMSMIVVELFCLFVLSALWLAVSGMEINTFNEIYNGDCTLTEVDFGGISAHICHDISALGPIAFVIAASFLAYSIFLLVCSFIASRRGQQVWLNSVRETTFFGPPKSRAGGIFVSAPSGQMFAANFLESQRYALNREQGTSQGQAAPPQYSHA